MNSDPRPERIGETRRMPKTIITFILGLLFLGSSASLLTGCDRGDRVQLVLEATRKGPSGEAMDKARDVIERRLGAAGASGVTVVRDGPHRILATFGGARDTGPVKALIGRSARLDFWLVDTSVTAGQFAAGEAPPGTRFLAFPSNGPGARIAVSGRSIVNGSMIVDAQPAFDPAGQPAVNLRFNELGGRRFARATRENVGRPFAIVLDDVVVSAPNINEPILGGEALISGNFTAQSANDLAIALRSGALPFDLVVVEERRLER
jgi:preprotein translocase subunit SecD